MNRGLKHMLWMSWNFRSRTLCINYIIGNKIAKIISHNYSNAHEDLSWSERLNPLKKAEKWKFYSSKDCTDILETIKDSGQNMDLKNTLDTLTALVNIANKDKSTRDFSYHQGLKILCKNLLKQIRIMTLNEVIYTFKLLNIYGVPTSTVVMQSLLQVIRNSINQLHIDQVHLLMSILRAVKPTPLSSALVIALPILLPSIINNKLDHENLHELSLALHYLECREMGNELVNLCRSIQSVINKQNFNDDHVYDINKIFISLCLIPNIYYNSDVILHTISLVQEVIFSRLNKLNVKDIKLIIRSLSYSVAHGFMAPYKPIFINSSLQALINKHINVPDGCMVLLYLNNINYVYKPFIEYITQKHMNDLSNIHNLRAFLYASSNADFNLLQWKAIENKLFCPEVINSMSTQEVLDFTIALMSMDRYYPRLVSTVFYESEALIEKPWNRKKLLTLYQSVKALYPEYEGPWPSKNVLDHLCETLTLKPVPVKKTLRYQLEEAMGGPQYVLSFVKTKIGHFIDYVIIMRKDGHAIAFNNDQSDILRNFTNYVEDLRCPPESYTILIRVFPFNAYTINTQQLMNKWKLQLKSMEKWTGHKCIDININAWEALPPHKKVLYFMEKIKQGYNDVATKT